MAYPTGLLSKVLEDVDRRMIGIRQLAVRRRDEMAAGNVPAGAVLHDLLPSLRTNRARLMEAATTPGLGAYAQSQKDDGELDIAAVFNAVIAAIDNVTGWIVSNFPKDGNGFLLAYTLGQDGVIERQFSPAETATLRTQLDALIATID